MNDKYSNVFKVIGIISVVMFVLMGLLTFFVDKYGEEATTEEAEPTKKVSLDGKDNKKKEGEVVVNEPLETDPYEELNELIGLEGVKEEINTLANFVKVQKMRSEKGLKTPKMSYHLVFTGSPGTGKTTVARIVARIYKDLGILKSGHMVETDRSGLVAEYMGQTAVKTNAICDSALNGVLFIDEAYALVPKNDNGGDYGQEAISTLLKRLYSRGTHKDFYDVCAEEPIYAERRGKGLSHGAACRHCGQERPVFRQCPICAQCLREEHPAPGQPPVEVVVGKDRGRVEGDYAQRPESHDLIVTFSCFEGTIYS